MKCPQCGFENSPGMKFCGECGAKLVVICPACQSQNPPSGKFCGECGARLQAAPPPTQPVLPPEEPAPASGAGGQRPGAGGDRPLSSDPRPPGLTATPKVSESHRKLVAILFADVSGFTAMSEQLDHEDVNEIMRSCWQRLDSIVIRYGGTVDKHVGDAIMATFGADEDHEDDPIRAVKSALAMQQSLHEFGAALERGTGLTLRMRVGVNMGEVTVGEVAESTGERSVIGPAVNLASRLEHNARVGAVLVSDAIYRHTRWLFDYMPLEPREIKGIEGKVPTFELVGEKPVPDQDRGFGGVETELVGRERELGVLQDCLRRLSEGHGTVVTLVGEAGVGKSRLTSEFRSRAADGGVAWHTGRCFSYNADTPHGLLLDLLHSFFGLAKGSSETEVIESIRDCLRHLVADEEEREERAALIASLFSVRIPNAFVDSADPKLRHELTMAALRSVLLTYARKHPAVLVLEDLHWVDSSSMAFFNGLARSVEGASVILLCQYRPDFVPTWGALRGIAQIDLSAFSSEQTAALVMSILKTSSLPSGLAPFIFSKSDGNPYFIEEIVKALLDSGSLVEVEGCWQVAGDVEALRVSATIQELLNARIGRLRGEVRRTLELAAVIGRNFPRRVLEEACEGEVGLVVGLETLSQEGMIVQRSLYPEQEYSFRHAMVQDVAYNGISRRQRFIYHERVAKAMERVYADRLIEVVETVANHYYLSQNAARAVRYLVEAGNKARDAYANQEALQLYEKALEVIDRPARSGVSFLMSQESRLPDEEVEGRRFEALLNRADVSLLVGDSEKALESYRTLMNLCRRAPEPDARQLADLHRRMSRVYEARGDYVSALTWLEMGLDVLGTRRVQTERRLVGAQLFSAGASVFFRQGDYGHAAEWVNQALSIIEKTDHLVEQAQCYSLLGALARSRGDSALAIEYREKALVLQERAGEVVAAMATYNNLGVTYYDLGEWDKALSYFEKALVVREKMNDVRAIAGLSNNVGLIHLGRGEFDKARGRFERVLTISRDAGLSYEEALALLNLGTLWLALDELDQAENCLESCLGVLDQIRSKVFLSEALSRLSELRMAQGVHEEALSVGEKALGVARELNSSADLGLAARAVGRALAAQGSQAEAEKSLLDSISAFEETRNLYGLAKTRFELGLLYGRMGREEEKGNLMEQAYKTFHHLGAERDLLRMEREL